MILAIIAFIFVIGILVFIHELGHFMLAKWSGVRVEKFSLGFGKKLFGFTRGETEYLVCMLPLGGYVKMYGEGTEGNFIIDGVESDTRADKSGFKSGDRITKIGNVDLKSYPTWKKLLFKLQSTPEETYPVEIERDDKKITIDSTPEDFTGGDIYSEKEYPRGFSNQSIFHRLLIVIAGPMMNFLLPFIFLPLVFMIGINVPAYLEKEPVVGIIGSETEAAAAGFLKGDLITHINNKKVNNWRDVTLEIQTNPDVLINVGVIRDGNPMELQVKTKATEQGIVTIGLGEVMDAKVGATMSGTPAEAAGLIEGDKILKINDTAIRDWQHMSSIIKENADTEILMIVNRGGVEQEVKITPQVSADTGKGMIGIEPFTEEIVKKYGFFESIIKGIIEAANMIIEVTVLLFGFLFKLVTGKIALGTAGKSLAGPILIAKISGSAAAGGIAQLLKFTSFISINLAIINLFPIPMLDGGHVLYLTLESIKKKPLSQRTMEISQRIGLTVLIFIMFLAIYNDISRVKGDIMSSLSRVVEVFR